ncbi:MAG: hypothetical protein ACREOF_21015 [Gemmatimonadales bacterium]
MSPIRLHPLVLCATLALVAGCGDAAGPLEDRQVDELGAALRDEVETAVGGFTVRGAVLPFSERRAGTGAALAALPLCAAGAPNAESADGDPVPDSVVFTFTVPPCSYGDVRDGRVEVTGVLEIVDPSPAIAGFGYVARLHDLAFRYISPELTGNYTVLRNGTRSLDGGPSGLSQTVALQVRRALADFDAAVSQNWTATLTPAAGATLVVGQLPPDGTIDIQGTLDWSRPNEAFSLVVSTPTPLQYDADCTDTPQRIRSGELRAEGTFAGEAGYVRLEWTDCGDEPRIRYVAAGE